MTSDDVATVMRSGTLFDAPPRREATERFLSTDGHHLLVAFADNSAVGFATGIEMTHPDKGTEMMLYELGVEPGFRNRGIGTALASALRELATQRGCYGMWVPIEPDNPGAVATYRRAQAGEPEPAAIMTWELPTPGPR